MKPRHLPLLASLAFAHSAAAQEIIKANNTDALNLTTSWVGGSVPGTDNVAVWDSTVTAANTVSLGADPSWQGVRIANPGGLVTIGTAGTLTLGSAGIDMSAATQNLTLSRPVIVGASQTWNIASGRTLTQSSGSAITLSSGTTLTMSGAGTVRVTGGYATGSSGAVEVNGATWILDSAGTNRSGTTTLTSGIISILNNSSPLGTGALALNGGRIGSNNGTGRTLANATTIGGNVGFGGTGLSTGTMTFSGAVNLNGGNRTLDVAVTTTFTGGISNGSITKSGTGEININSTATWSGPLTINQGKVGITHVNGLGGAPDVVLGASGTFSLGTGFDAGTATIGNLSGSGIVDTAFGGSNTTRTLRVTQTTDATFSGRLMDAGSSRLLALHKDGAATLTLTASNHTFTGATTISSGKLRISGTGLLGGTTYAGAITNNGTLDFDSTASQTLSGTLTGGGALGKSNTGTLTFSGDGSGFNGTTTVTGGQLTLNGTLGGYVLITAGARLSGTGGSVGSLATEAGSSLVLAGGATTAATTFNQGVAFDALGSTFMEFATTPVDTTVYDVVTYGSGFLNNFSNLTPLARGTLANDTTNNKITFTAGAAGSRTWSGGDGIWNRLGTLTNWQEGDQKYFNGDTVTFGDIVSDSNIILEGILTPGGTTVTVSNTANTYTFTGTGSISGGVGLDKTGDGTIVLATANNFTGATNISAGTLALGNAAALGSGSAAVSVASGATLDLNGISGVTKAAQLNGGALVNSSATAATYAGAVTFGTSTASQVGGSGSLTLSAAFTGAGDLVKAGAGTVSTTADSNAFTGNIIVNGGTLNLSNAIRGSASLTVNAGATANIGRTNMFVSGHGVALAASRVITVDGGTLIMNSAMDARIGNVTLANGATWTSDRPLTAFDVLLGNVGDGTIPATVAVTGSGAATMNGTGGIHLQGVQNFDVANTTNDAAADLLVSMRLDNPGNAGGAAGGIHKTGEGTMLLSANNTYTGATLVSAGTLLVNGSLGNTSITVDANATIGGIGALGGSLSFNGAALLEVVDFNDPLAVAGTITFGSGFGIANLTGIDWDSLAFDTPYTVLSTTQTFGTGDIANFGIANAVTVGTGRYAYFQNGSLAVVVIPEPAAALLGGLGILTLLRRRRC